jgi:hypothetical protein
MLIRGYSIFFLVVLTSYLMRPLLPFVEYAVNNDYIVKNLCVNRDNPKSCCNGRCHLKKELAKSDESEDTAKNNHSKKTPNQPVDEFIKAPEKKYKETTQNHQYPFISVNVNLCFFTSSVFVPPRNFS